MAKKNTQSIPSKWFLQLRDLFVRYGFRSPSMDDIASDLGVSKKTLYLYVKNKEGLIIHIIKYMLADYESQLVAIQEKELNQIEELNEMTGVISLFFLDFHQKAIQDLNRFYPKAFILLDDFQNKKLLKFVHKNLKNGETSGIFRQGIAKKLIAEFFIQLIKLIENKELGLHTTKPPAQIIHALLSYHLHAIVTDKGRELLG